MKTLLFFRKIVFILSCLIIISLSGAKNNQQKPYITLYEILNHVKNSNTPYLQHKKFYPLWEKLEHIARKKDLGIYAPQTIENFIRYCEKYKNSLKNSNTFSHINIIRLINLIQDDLKQSLNPKAKNKCPLKTCSICQEKIDPSKELFIDLKCCRDSIFHEKCLINWYAGHQYKHNDAYQKCPLCRRTFTEYVQFLMEKTDLYKKTHEEKLINLGRDEIVQEVDDLLGILGISYQPDNDPNSDGTHGTFDLDDNDLEILAEYYILSELNTNPTT